MHSPHDHAKRIATRLLGPIEPGLHRAAARSTAVNPLLRRGVQILSTKASLDVMLDGSVNVARFGDGEISLLLGIAGIGFQRPDQRLARRLREVLAQDPSTVRVGLPRGLVEFTSTVSAESIFWGRYRIKYGRRIARLLPRGSVYVDAAVTRPYIPTRDVARATEVFDRFRAAWHGRDVLLVEGSYSRIGVGTDLFDGARSVRRIICPAQHAFDRIDEIRAAVLELGGSSLVLGALGPTATVLAAELGARGTRFLDIGHLDLEYLWMQGGGGRFDVPGRMVNEVRDETGLEIPPSLRAEFEAYRSQIVATLDA